jgi:hypothetical protein
MDPTLVGRGSRFGEPEELSPPIAKATLRCGFTSRQPQGVKLSATGQVRPVTSAQALFRDLPIWCTRASLLS